MLIDLHDFESYQIVQFNQHTGDICLKSRFNAELSIWFSKLPPELFAGLFQLLPKAPLCFEMTSDARFIPYNPPNLGLPPDTKFTHTKPNIGEAGTDYIPAPEPTPMPEIDPPN